MKQKSYLEHSNLTVNDPDQLASLLCRLFDWNIRWAGEALDQGYTVHVGEQDSYLALYSHDNSHVNTGNNHFTENHLNHIGIVVEDLAAIRAKVVKENLKPFNERSYEPGSRFYFLTNDNLEFEVVSYS